MGEIAFIYVNFFRIPFIISKTGLGVMTLHPFQKLAGERLAGPSCLLLQFFKYAGRVLLHMNAYKMAMEVCERDWSL